MRRDAQAARMCAPLPIHDQNVRRRRELFHRFQHDRNFAEREQTRNVRKRYRHARDRIIHRREIGAIQHHNRRARDSILRAFKADVNPRDPLRVIGRAVFDNTRRELALNRHRV